jgi:hypothetical protein
VLENVLFFIDLLVNVTRPLTVIKCRSSLLKKKLLPREGVRISSGTHMG